MRRRISLIHPCLRGRFVPPAPISTSARLHPPPVVDRERPPQQGKSLRLDQKEIARDGRVHNKYTEAVIRQTVVLVGAAAGSVAVVVLAR